MCGSVVKSTLAIKKTHIYSPTPRCCFSTICNSSSHCSDTLFWPQQVLQAHDTQTHSDEHWHIKYKKKLDNKYVYWHTLSCLYTTVLLYTPSGTRTPWVSSVSCMRSFLTNNFECVYLCVLPIILYQLVKKIQNIMCVCVSYHTVSTCKKNARAFDRRHKNLCIFSSPKSPSC